MRTAIAKMTSKGQVTIPKAVRDALNLRTGDRIEFILTEDGQIIMKPRTKRVEDLIGMLEKETSVKSTIEEMNEAVREKFRREFR